MLAKSLLAGSDAETIKIFYSYSRKDKTLRDNLDMSLGELKWDVAVEPWHDGNIPPGDPWEDEIHQNLKAANIILLFISNNFMKSEYCNEIEAKLALEYHENGEARVIPVILEETIPDWRESSFAKLQVLPQNGQPVTAWESQKEAFDQIAQGIVNIIVNQGINPKFRQRWHLHMEGSVKEFSSSRLALQTLILKGL